MVRVASIPFNIGMRTSITTTSGCSSAARPDRFQSVGRLPDNLHIRGLLQQLARAFPDNFMILGQQYFYHHWKLS